MSDRRPTATLNLLRARNRGYYVGVARNALRAYYVPITCVLRAHYVHVIGSGAFVVVVVLTVTNGKKPLQMRI